MTITPQEHTKDMREDELIVPEVIYLIDMGDEIVWCDSDNPSGNEEGAVKYIRADSVSNHTRNDWVSVEDFPDEGRYIVCADTDDGYYVTEMEWNGKSWIYNGEPTYCGTLWISPRMYQPLPSLPEKD